MKIFNRNDTYSVKGVAIIAMLLHHYIDNNPRLPIWEMVEFDFWTILGVLGKVCVPLFVIMSGYGLAQKYGQKNNDSMTNIRFVVSHYCSFLSIYYCVYAIMFILALRGNGYDLVALYGSGSVGIANLISDLLGIRGLLCIFPGMTQPFFGDWFVSTIVILYWMFPVFWILVKKFKKKWIAISYIPCLIWLVAKIFGFDYIGCDNLLFVIFPFSIGILFSQNQYLDKIKNMKVDNMFRIKILIALCSLIACRLCLAVSVDVFVAICIIVIVCITNNNMFKSFFVIYGKYSANIWLINIFTIFVLKQRIRNELLCFIVLMVVTLLFSWTLEKIKHIIGYENTVVRIRKYIEGKQTR